MAIADKLKDEGWHLSDEAIRQFDENGSITDVKAVIEKALDVDLREIGAASFPEDVGKDKPEIIPGKLVVQIQKIRNVSAPKANEESRGAPRMLKLSLTDGHSVCQAVEMEPLSCVSLNTPPGTKLLLTAESIPMAHGIMQLRPTHIRVLGGRVQHMVEKWELNRSLAKHSRGRIVEEGGPPPWIPFGQKIMKVNSQDRNFKSLESAKDKENRENAEFEAQRKDAIAEAARGGAKKVFGGGNKPLLDHNVQQIVDLGYSVEQAETALRQCRNNVDKALRNLQRREQPRMLDVKPKGEERERRKRGEREEESGAPPKPSASVSLFDFLQNKLPVQNEKEPEQSSYVSSSSGGVRRQASDSGPRSAGVRNSVRGGRGSSRGGRGGRGPQLSAPERASPSASYHHPAHREDRSRHSFTSSSSTNMQQQKPPRFQNQQRYQQQQQQQQHSENTYQQWGSSYNENSYISNHWAPRNALPSSNNSRSTRDEFPSDQHDTFPPNYNDNRNRPLKQQPDLGGFGNSYDMDSRTNRSVPRNYDKRGFGQQSQQHESAPQYGKFGSNSGGFQRNQLFGVDFYKDSSTTPGSSSLYSGFGGGVTSEPTPSCQYSPDTKPWQWQKGDKCMAKYWEDNMYYNAEVTGVSERTCVVRFVEYGNFEEVLQDDCLPFAEGGSGQDIQSPASAFPNTSSDKWPQQTYNHFSGILEFRRGGTRPYIKTGGADGVANRDRKPPRIQQQMYVPPAQRK